MAEPRVITVIPAKGNSRRIPGKNRALLAGKPLVVHAVEQAIASQVCGDICVYTDDAEIARLAEAAGAEVPFLRSGDTDDLTGVGQAALNLVRQMSDRFGRNYDILGLLLTTSPLRLPEDIAACYDILAKNDALDAAMSFNFPGKHPYWAWIENTDGTVSPMFPEFCHLDRAEVPKTYFVDGSVYFARIPFFDGVNGDQYKGRVGAYYMPSERGIDVDTPFDLDLCEFLLAKRANH